MIGIYKISSPTGKVYIGPSRNIVRRFATYKRMNCKEQPKLYNSFKKYGVDNHLFEVLIECSETELNYYETFYIKQYQSHKTHNLNCRMDGLYQIASEETRKKISAFHKGKTVSEETRKKLSALSVGRPSANKGKKMPKDFVEKQRLDFISRGIYKGENNPFFGKKHSEETLLKMRGKSKGAGGKNTKARLVLNLETGIFYDCVKEAGETTKYKQEHFRGMLNGNKKNKTSFIHV